jgi:outer membrane biosynthesis protein TonB
MSQSLNTSRSRLSAASLAGDRRSAFGFVGAIMLHAGVIAATLFSFAHRLDIADQTPPVVPVDLVTIAQKTDIAPQQLEAPKVDEVTPPPLVTQQPQIQPPEQQAEAAPMPETAPSQPLIKQKAVPHIVPMLKPAPPQPHAKTKFDINSIMALLDKSAPKSAPSTAKRGTRTIKGFGAQNAMTADLVDSLRSQIERCWSPPVGAPNATELVVDFDLFLNPDGTVAQPPQLIGSYAAPGTFRRAAQDAAMRAIYECAPYKLPVGRYSEWREINPFHFDPRQMMGQ